MIKQRDGYSYDKTDLTYDNNKSIMKTITITFAAGTLGGIVGIAGGMILNPLLLSLGMLPMVVAATNQYLAMVSSTSVSS